MSPGQDKRSDGTSSVSCTVPSPTNWGGPPDAQWGRSGPLPQGARDPQAAPSWRPSPAAWGGFPSQGRLAAGTHTQAVSANRASGGSWARKLPPTLPGSSALPCLSHTRFSAGGRSAPAPAGCPRQHTAGWSAPRAGRASSREARGFRVLCFPPSSFPSVFVCVLLITSFQTH